MTLPRNAWSIGPSGGRRVLREGVTVRGTYSLTGAASGSPRTVTYWRLGLWLRVELDGQVAWLDGSEGVFGRLENGVLTPIGPAAVFRHPVSEADWLESAEQA